MRPSPKTENNHGIAMLCKIL